MLVLRTYPAGFNTPSQSPFCVKVMLMLVRSGARWRAHYMADPRKAPKGKLPVLVDGDTIVADSWAIRAHLEETVGIDFDEGLSPRERAQAHAMARMVEEHLYFALVHDRWINDANWGHIRDAYFSEVPKLIRGVVTNGIRKAVRRDLNGQGTGRHTPTEILDRAREDVTAIKAAMAGTFMMGDQPSSADYSVGPFLQAIMASPADSPLTRLVADDPELAAYVERVAALLTPMDTSNTVAA